ncbi:MAG: hypothetical protein WCX74_02040 [Candidatus Paceibacterota bacterium]
MEKEDLLSQIDRILSNFNREGISEAVELLRIYAGEKSSFYKGIAELKPELYWHEPTVETAKGFLIGFKNFLTSGLNQGISIERKVQIDTVSDLLEQANILLISKEIHPAAPTMIMGAALEEFLRNWTEEVMISVEKKGIDSYAKALRENELIDKQDYKDITSWAGLRNSAAHGIWNEVEDKKRIGIMLEGINLFMRKYI